MRRLAMASMLLVVMAGLMGLSGGVAAAPPSDGTLVLMSGDETWTGAVVFDGVVRVQSDATLTVKDAAVSVAEGTQLFVEAGGTLVVDNSTLTAQAMPSMRVLHALNGRLHVPLPDGGSGTLTLRAPVGANLSGFSVGWDVTKLTTIDHDGQHTTIGYTAAQSTGGSAWLYVEEWNPFATFTLMQVQVGDDAPIAAASLDHIGFGLAGSPGWTLDVAGSASLSASRIEGAGVSITGGMHLNGGWLKRSGPVALGDGGSITGSTGGFNESLNDHDVAAVAMTVIDASAWSGASTLGWTGGAVDRWHRQVGGQILVFPGAGVVFDLKGLGQHDQSRSTVTSGTDGTWQLDMNSRLVEIGGANGSHWVEAATIESITWETNWGNLLAPDQPLGWNSSVIVDYPLPAMSIESVTAAASNGVSTETVSVTVRLANTGDADADVLLECTTSDGLDANTEPLDVGGLVAVGSSLEVTFDWSVPGELTTPLTCGVDPGVEVRTGGLTVPAASSTVDVAWSAEAEDGSSGVIVAFVTSLIIVAVAIALLVAVGVVTRMNDVWNDNETAEETAARIAALPGQSGDAGDADEPEA